MCEGNGEGASDAPNLQQSMARGKVAPSPIDNTAASEEYTTTSSAGDMQILSWSAFLELGNGDERDKLESEIQARRKSIGPDDIATLVYTCT